MWTVRFIADAVDVTLTEVQSVYAANAVHGPAHRQGNRFLVNVQLVVVFPYRTDAALLLTPRLRRVKYLNLKVRENLEPLREYYPVQFVSSESLPTPEGRMTRLTLETQLTHHIGVDNPA